MKKKARRKKLSAIKKETQKEFYSARSDGTNLYWMIERDDSGMPIRLHLGKFDKAMDL